MDQARFPGIHTLPDAAVQTRARLFAPGEPGDAGGRGCWAAGRPQRQLQPGQALATERSGGGGLQASIHAARSSEPPVSLSVKQRGIAGRTSGFRSVARPPATSRRPQGLGTGKGACRSGPSGGQPACGRSQASEPTIGRRMAAGAAATRDHSSSGVRRASRRSVQGRVASPSSAHGISAMRPQPGPPLLRGASGTCS